LSFAVSLAQASAVVLRNQALASSERSRACPSTKLPAEEMG
jgi:hypothetical protein